MNETNALPPLATTAPLKSKWPTTLGIITLIFGILGLLQAAFTPFGQMMTDGSVTTLPEESVDAELTEHFLQEASDFAVLSGITSGLTGLLLVVGSVALLKRKQSSSLILQIWAVVKILAGGWVTFKQLPLTRLQIELMTASMDSSGLDMTHFDTVTHYVTLFSVGFGLLFLLALPVFLIIWFNRDRIREEVATW